MDISDSVRQVYEEQTLLQQSVCGKTLKSRTQDGLRALLYSGGTIVLVSMLLLFHVLDIQVSETFQTMGLFFGIFSFFLLAIGLIFAPLLFVMAPVMLFSYAIRPKNTIVCPFCGKQHILFTSVASYVCDGCSHLLLLRGKIVEKVEVVECPVCHSRWGASAQFGRCRCINCGTELMLNEDGLSSVCHPKVCDHCESKCCDGMYVCTSCGALCTNPQRWRMKPYTKNANLFSVLLLQPPEENSLCVDAITQRAKSPFGHLVDALWLLRDARKTPRSKYKLPEALDAFESVLTHLMIASESGIVIHIDTVQAVEELTVQLCRHSIAYGDRFLYDFTSKAEIASWRQRLESISTQFYMLMSAAGVTRNWPLPLLNLVFERIERPNGQKIFRTKVSNMEQIRVFLDAAGIVHDFEEVAAAQVLSALHPDDAQSA